MNAWAIVWLASGVIVHQPSERVCMEQARAIGEHVRCIEVRVPCCCGGAAPVAPVAPMPWQRGEAIPAPLPPVAHAQPILEPGSLALLAVGLVALALARRG